MDIDPDTIIGKGAFGIVALIGGHPKVAAKYTVKDTSSRNSSFTKEHQALEILRHPNIVQYYGFGTEGIFNVIRMEYCERNSLFEVLNKPSIIYSMKTVFCWAEHLFAALSCLQQLAIVHRDIKPNNILVTLAFVLKLADFGCVRDMNAMTTASFVGTYRYMSPEASGSLETRQINALNDLYSIGLVRWEMVERRLVYSQYVKYEHFDYLSLFHDLWHDEYKLEEVECVENNLKRLIARCTEARPEKRGSIDECYHDVLKLNEITTTENFEPLILGAQTELLRPVGFDGTKEWITVVKEETSEANLMPSGANMMTSRKTDRQLTTGKIIQVSQSTEKVPFLFQIEEANQHIDSARRTKRNKWIVLPIIACLLVTISVSLWSVKMDIDPDTIIGKGAFGIVALIGGHPKVAAKYTVKDTSSRNSSFTKEPEALDILPHPIS